MDKISIKNDLNEIKKALKDLGGDTCRSDVRRLGINPSLSCFEKEMDSREPLRSRLLSLPNDINSTLNNTDIGFLEKSSQKCKEPNESKNDEENIFNGEIFNLNRNLSFHKSKSTSSVSPPPTSMSVLTNDNVPHILPTAPPLSQISVTDGCFTPSNYETESKKVLYSSKVKSVIKLFDNKSLPSSEAKKTPVIRVSNNNGKYPPRLIKDSNGYTTVFSSNRNRKAFVGTRKTTSTGLKGAEKSFDLYIGRCDPSVDEETVTKYLQELEIQLLSCETLNSKIKHRKSFKVVVKYSDKDKLLDTDVWPEGIICRRFHIRKQ